MFKPRHTPSDLQSAVFAAVSALHRKVLMAHGIGFAAMATGLVVVSLLPAEAIGIGALTAIALLLVIRIVSTTLRLHFLHQLEEQVFARIRREMLALSLGDRPSGPASLFGLDHDARAIAGFWTRFADAQRGVVLAFGLVFFLMAAPLGGIGVLAGGAVALVFVLALSGLGTAMEARRQLTDFERLGGVYADRIRHLPLIRRFAAGPFVGAELEDKSRRFHRSVMALLARAFISSAAMDLVILATFVALAAASLGEARASPWGWAAIFIAATELFGAFRALSAVYQERQLGEAALARLTARTSRIHPGVAPARIPLERAPRVHLANAVARFSDGSAHALTLSFTAEAGAITLLTGPSGRGKSTALHLIAGIVPLASGEITIGEHRWGEGDTPRAQIGWLSQRPFLFDAALVDNIRFFRDGLSDGDIRKAAQAACLEEFAPDLMRRLDWRGTGLSGGQAQRIGLARALAGAPALLLLDEPTAALDDATEAEFLDHLVRLKGHSTIILSSHSPAAHRIADHVVVL
jgi:ATP-binding cassette, subfamily C, bacterial CydD